VIDERRRLEIELATAGPIRDRVGPLAWFVLETLAVRTSPGGSVVEVVGSTRELAVTMGTSKDTVARALRALTAAGVVQRFDHRDHRTGRFVSTTYRVDLAACGLSLHAGAASGDAEPARRDDGGDACRAPVSASVRRRTPESSGSQLSLLS
jgi:DNA-binding MarR family transcriptional regulator